MSQQGGRPTRHEDDWWRQLYDDSTEDTGPTAAPDSLDDRFTSAKNAVAGRPGGARRDTGGPSPHEPAQPPPPEPPLGPAPERPPGERVVPAQRTPAPPGTPPAPAGTPPAPAGTPPATAGPAAPAGPTGPPLSSAPAGPTGPTVSSAPVAPAGSMPPSASAAPPVPPAAQDTPPARRAPWEPPPAEPGTPVTFPPVEGGAGDRMEAVRASAGSSGPEPPASPSAAGPRPAVPSADPSAPPLPPPPPSSLEYVGSGPPTYDPEPTALPAADPDDLGELVADTALDGARYGACTLRAVSLRGDSARYRGEPRRDSLLTARFGTGEQALVLVAMATGARATPSAHLAAAEACQLIGRAVGRSHQRLVEDLRAARRGDLKSGLHRLTDRSVGKLRASAVEQDLDPDEYTASLRCLLLPADPDCRTRVFFGVGGGGLFRLRDGEWQDIEPHVSPADTTGEPVLGFGSPPAETPEGDRLTMDLGIPTPPSPYEPAPEPPREPFRFRASVARPGDVLVMGTEGLAEPLRGEPALCAYLARRWSGRTPPGLAAFLADVQVRVKGYADDRTAAAVWEA
ncbi:protein phosphatase 2C domain-containing protein [Streptomyces sp. NPDC007905]|uniref:protein phosphatase 2C domain-containing protein n=1 Tax=Streptomyces sp. NPDC007905 TaxID=3364788 RepID=UPI0036ED2537